MSIFNGIINGTKFGIYDGSTLIAYATSGSMTINHSLRESSNKESMGWKEQLEGQRDWEMSLEGVVAFLGAGASAGAGSAISNKTFDEIFSGYIFDGSSGTGSDGRNIISIKFSTEETGDFKYTGDGWVTSMSLDAPNEDTCTYSMSISGTGAITQAAA